MSFFEDKRKMRKRLAALALALVMPLSLASPLPVDAQDEATDLQRELIPLPLEYNVNEGKFTLSENASIYVAGATEEQTAELLRTAKNFATVLRRSTGFEIPVVEGTAQTGDIQFTTADADSEMGNQGYSIETTETGITVTAYQPEGIFNGVQTLRQLFPADIEKQEVVEGVSWDVPCTTINDKPEYEFRSMQLDSVRHFLSVEQVQRQIDFASQYKINKLHLRLADDQGWRIEIDGEMYGESFDKLRTIGASTSCTSNGVSAGMYTKEDFKKIVDYAQERYVEVIPEIDMPGHSWAALVSLNFLNSTEDGKPHSGNYDNTKPYEGWDVGFSTLECRNEKTYEFLDEVIKQLAAISPSQYIHIGGDEAHSTSAEDYSYFMTRVTEIAHKYGKTPIGWQHYDRVIQGKENVATQYWLTDGAKLKDGVNYVVSPANYAYLDMKYDSKCEYGLTWATMNPVDDAYNWDPTNYGTKDQILGIEAPLFGETIRTNEALDYMIYPRLTGHAEIGWTPKDMRSWDDYKARISTHDKRLENQGIGYRRDEKIWPKPYDEKNIILPFEEGEGTTTTDTKGKFTAELHGGVTWVEGKYGTGVHLNGTDAFIDLKADDLRDGWTIGMWVKPEATTGSNAVLISGYEGELKLDQWNKTGKVGATKFGAVDHSFDYSAPIGEWVHLAFTGDSTGTSLYVNGEFNGKASNVVIQGPAYRIGGNKKSGLESSGYMQGTLDCVELFDNVLSADEIKGMMEEPKDETTEIEWTMDEGEGNKFADTTGRFNGSFTTGVEWVEGKTGSALHFDGTGYAELGLADITGDWTIGMWVNREEAAYNNAVLLSSASGNLKLEQYKDTKNVGFTKPGVADYAFDYSAPVGEWVHLTFKKDSTGTTLYANGQNVAHLGDSIDAPLSRLGANVGSGLADFGNMKATIDNLHVFKRALTDDEILALSVDKAQLGDAIETITAAMAELKQDEYVGSTWIALQNALEKANSVYYNEKATQEEVDEALVKLEAAFNNLVKSVYTVTVNGEEVYKGAYNDKVTVTAPVVEGQTFTAWLWKGKVVSTDETYTFFLSQDMELTASYEAVEMNAEAILTNTILTKRADTKADIKFVAQLIVPEGYTVKDAGLVWSSKEEAELSLDNTNLKPTHITKISTTNQFSVTIKGMPAGRFIRGKIFATLVDSEGNTTTVYSEEARVVNK